MKKYLIIVLCFLLFGCGKNNEKDILNKVKDKSINLDTYNLKGELSMYNGDNKYTYDVNVKYKKDSLYRVSLINKVNNHEQIILRNKESVYVLTPSLNKSFKFQSDWPYNNSQVYILERILDDIDNDSNRKYEYSDSMHIFTTKVEYSTNNELTSQKVYFDDNYKLKKVEVYNSKEEKVMDFNALSFEENISIDDKEFELNNNIDTSSSDNKNTDSEDNKENKDTVENKENTVSKTIDDIVYPMYLPDNTYLTKQERVNKDDGQRVILTFAGDKSFTLIEETVTVNKDLDLDITYGEPGIIIDTIGTIEDKNINWYSNNIEYSLISNELDKNELISVAKSISSQSITK